MNKPEIIKFEIEHDFRSLEGFDISEFCRYKSALREKGLIGTLESGKFQGYDCGNMSIRVAMNGGKLNVLITGTQTSGKSATALEDFALVLNYDVKSFLIKSRGMSKPSSEAPLHWAAYEADRKIMAIIHAHVFEYDPLYKHVLTFLKANNMPLTLTPSKTLEIGLEVKDLIKNKGYKDVIGMLNHDGGFGLLSLGTNMREAYLKLIHFQKQLSLIRTFSNQRSKI